MIDPELTTELDVTDPAAGEIDVSDATASSRHPTIPIAEATHGDVVLFFNYERPCGWREGWLVPRTKKQVEKNLYPVVIPRGDRILQVLVPGSKLTTARQGVALPPAVAKHLEKMLKEIEVQNRKASKEAKAAAKEAAKLAKQASKDAKEAEKKAKREKKERRQKYQEGVGMIRDQLLIAGD